VRGVQANVPESKKKKTSFCGEFYDMKNKKNKNNRVFLWCAFVAAAPAALGGGGPAPKAAPRVAASTPPPASRYIPGSSLRLPKPLSDQFPVRVCSCPPCIMKRL